MIVHVKLFASLRRYRVDLALGQAFDCELHDGGTIQSLIVDVLKLPSAEVAISLVNGVQRDREFPLNEGDTVSLWPPIAGGTIRME